MMWIIEDNTYGHWTPLVSFETEEEAQVVLAKHALNPQLSNCQFRIVYEPNN